MPSWTIRIAPLAITDLPAMLSLQCRAEAPTGFLRSKSPEELARFLTGETGQAYGVIEGCTLVAFGLLALPSGACDGPAFPRVPKEAWPNGVAFLESTIVAPDARGRGYQRMLIDVRMRAASEGGRSWICSGAHLANVASWRNLLSCGMAIVGMRLDLGYPVLGLLKALDAPLALGAGRVRVPLYQAQAHEAALIAGMVGVALDGEDVVYRPARVAEAAPVVRAAMAL